MFSVALFVNEIYSFLIYFLFKEVSFHGEAAELIYSKTHRKRAKRQALEGLWIEYAWSVSNAAFHVRINRIQIDNQLGYTTFPVMLYPIVSKSTETDLAEKPFIELSVYESKTAGSNVMQFKYFKLLVQEFAVQIDQGLILAILAFLRPENVCFSVNFVNEYTFLLLQ